jgi:hypothetical protein
LTGRRDQRRGVRPAQSALAAAVARGEWERIALQTFVSIAERMRVSPATIDDLLSLLEALEDGDDG